MLHNIILHDNLYRLRGTHIVFSLTPSAEHRFKTSVKHRTRTLLWNDDMQRDIVSSAANRIDMNDIKFWPRGRALALSAASAMQQARRTAPRLLHGDGGANTTGFVLGHDFVATATDNDNVIVMIMITFMVQQLILIDCMDAVY